MLVGFSNVLDVDSAPTGLHFVDSDGGFFFSFCSISVSSLTLL